MTRTTKINRSQDLRRYGFLATATVGLVAKTQNFRLLPFRGS
jgi:hypothetical protein